MPARERTLGPPYTRSVRWLLSGGAGRLGHADAAREWGHIMPLEKKEGRRTRPRGGARQGGLEPGAAGAREDVGRGPGLVDVDPWAALLEKLLEEPADGDSVADATAGESGAGKLQQRRRSR